MSPYWSIAYKGARIPWLVSKEKEQALWIGRFALEEFLPEDRTLSYALVAGKVATLLPESAEKENLFALVKRAADNVSFPAKDRSRLYRLLGDHAMAKVIGEQSGLRDVVLKSRG